MATRKIEKARHGAVSLTGYRKRSSANAPRSRSPRFALGDQIETEWLPLLGISHDPKGDILDIALEGVDHIIKAPTLPPPSAASG